MCDSKSERRRSLLSKLKNLVAEIDCPASACCTSPCCPPCCLPCGPVIEIYDPLPKPCLPVCSPCPPPACSPCTPACSPCTPACCPCPGTGPQPSSPVPCCNPPPACCPVQLPPCMPICTPVPPPCVPVCNPCPEEQPCVPCNPPQMMVCYRRPKDAASNGDDKLKNCKSREIIASVLHVGCDCDKRNGLQDDCPRSDCRGSPECLTKPDPTCCPSLYQRERRTGKNGNHEKNLEEYQCYPAYVKLPSCCPPACGPCSSPCPPCGPCCPPCGPCCPPCGGPVCCPPPFVPLVAAPPCPPTVVPGPPPYVPVGSVVPTVPCCPPPCCPCPC